MNAGVRKCGSCTTSAFLDAMTRANAACVVRFAIHHTDTPSFDSDFAGHAPASCCAAHDVPWYDTACDSHVLSHPGTLAVKATFSGTRNVFWVIHMATYAKVRARHRDRGVGVAPSDLCCVSGSENDQLHACCRHHLFLFHGGYHVWVSTDRCSMVLLRAQRQSVRLVVR